MSNKYFFLYFEVTDLSKSSGVKGICWLLITNALWNIKTAALLHKCMFSTSNAAKTTQNIDISMIKGH